MRPGSRYTIMPMGEAELPIGENEEAAASRLLRAMSDAILAMAAEPRLERVLARLVDNARELAGARYAAIGVPEDEGEAFSQFIYTGMTDELVANIGPLPRKHGLLGAMLTETKPYRTADIRQDPRFQWWPDAHPRMSSFLGVPIVAKGRVIGAFYLADKIGAREFSQAEQETIQMLAAHAAVAIENARLYERNRELTVVEERNRLARELHDSVVQTLFSISLTAEAAAARVNTDAGAARRELEILRELARTALQETRSLVFELRPADVDVEGLAATLQKHADVVGRVSGKRIEVHAEEYQPQPAANERELFRIAQEALNNAIKHANSEHIEIGLTTGNGHVRLSVVDDGAGFDPADPQIRLRRLGITSIEERAEELNGRLRILSRPGRGTRVEVEVPAV
jgi:signal transduction histidine kinase